MAQHFIVFETSGYVIHEEGTRPRFLNSFIKNIDCHTLHGYRCVQDKHIYYVIRGKLIFMVTNFTKDDKCLDEKIKEYEAPATVDEKFTESDDKDEFDFSTTKPLKKDVADPIEGETKQNQSIISRGFNLFRRKIHRDDLKDKIVFRLIEKNVETEIAKSLGENVMNNIKEEWVGENEFKEEMENTLSKYIKKIDHDLLLKDIKNARSNNKIFSFCFIGTNGVGKSTTVAKMCYWLLQKGLKVYLAACDTFRAGAVEQLKIHATRFSSANNNQVGFHDEGYGKDDFIVCKAALKNAKDGGYDVVLIDTSGRMHTNKRLMQSLSKLIKSSRPDHIVFVGEALIGGDSVDQLKTFNKYVSEESDRKIDSILLTKMDTVDDKIGQVVNMTVSAQAPIIFAGTGQSNVDLFDIDAKVISNILMS